jgi:hypothetical protein
MPTACNHIIQFTQCNLVSYWRESYTRDSNCNIQYYPQKTKLFPFVQREAM